MNAIGVACFESAMMPGCSLPAASQAEAIRLKSRVLAVNRILSWSEANCS